MNFFKKNFSIVEKILILLEIILQFLIIIFGFQFLELKNIFDVLIFCILILFPNLIYFLNFEKINLNTKEYLGLFFGFWGILLLDYVSNIFHGKSILVFDIFKDYINLKIFVFLLIFITGVLYYVYNKILDFISINKNFLTFIFVVIGFLFFLIGMAFVPKFFYQIIR